MKLKQLLDGGILEIVELRKDVARKRFGIEVFKAMITMSIFIWDYHLFDRLLQYLSPGATCSI